MVAHENVKDVKIKNDQVAFVQQDLFLLENQLPYQLLNYLMKKIKEENSKMEDKLRKSIQKFIDKQSMLAGGKKSPNAQKAIHLLDLLRKRLLGLDGVEHESAQKNATDKEEDGTEEDKSDKNEENDERDDEDEENDEREWHSFRSVQELRQVGIHLKPRKSSHLGEIDFKKKMEFLPGNPLVKAITTLGALDA